MSFRDEALTKCLESLTDRERRVLEMRFGLKGAPRSLDEIGRAFDVSRERVRQIESLSLKKLRSLAEVQQLGNEA